MWIEIYFIGTIYHTDIVTPLAGVWIEILDELQRMRRALAVTPLAGVWIEILRSSFSLIGTEMSLPLRECGLKLIMYSCTMQKQKVTPLAGVWIEIVPFVANKQRKRMSLPLRECGLKFYEKKLITYPRTVTPLAGVWIEIISSQFQQLSFSVTPLAGVWIEIPNQLSVLVLKPSLPLRECGLKLMLLHMRTGHFESLPLRECGLKFL